MTRKRWVVVCVVVLVGAGLGWLGYSNHEGGKSPGHAQDARAIPVLTKKAVSRDVPVTLQGVGTVHAYQKVTVRPQVSGKLARVDFQEGQHVDKGDLLAKIDPVIYKARLDKARAQLDQDQAALANDRLTLQRNRKLVKNHFVSQEQLDQSRAKVRQDKALIQLDQAAIAEAKANLGYTSIKAPISGRTGLREVDAGNIVDTSDSLVRITQLQPISVRFTLPASKIHRISQAQAKDDLPVTVATQSGGQVLGHGRLRAIDNHVNQNTGTVQLKAVLSNTDRQLWPGQFVNVRLQVDVLKNATVVPLEAVRQGPKGAYVYRLGEDGKAEVQPVDVRQRSETRAVIEKGIQPGAVVITSGFSQLTDGASVKTESGAGSQRDKSSPRHGE